MKISVAILTICGTSSSVVGKDVRQSPVLCEATCSDDDVCKFTTKVDLFTGELGYYRFEECGDVDNPTLRMDVGKTYQFVQSDVSN